MALYEKTITDNYSGDIYCAKSNDPYLLEQKIQRKREVWAKKQARQENLDHKESQIELAESNTEEAVNLIEEVNNILNHTLSIDDKIEWEKLYKKDKFKSFVFDAKEPLKDEFNKIIPAISTFEYYLGFYLPFLFKGDVELRAKCTKEANELYKNAYTN